MLPAISLSPPVVAVSRPTQAWSQSFTLSTHDLPTVKLRPVLEASEGGSWRPIRLPGLHLPTTLTVLPGQPTRITLSDPGIEKARGQLTLALQFVPVWPPGQQGVRVLGTPQASLYLGHAAPVVSRLSIVGIPWLTTTRHVPAAMVTVTDTGQTWMMPTVNERYQGRVTAQAAGNLPLLPGQSATLPIPAPSTPLHWGFNRLTWSSPGGLTTTTIIAVPAGPIGVGVGAGLVVELVNLMGRRRHPSAHPQTPKEEQS